MGQYTSYYLYQKFEKRDGQDFIPVYPNTYSVDADGTMPKVVKNENDENCGYTPPAPDPIYRWVQVTPTSDPNSYWCDECSTEPIYRWTVITPTSDPSTYYCDECQIVPIYRWANSGTTCVNCDKYQRGIKQVSYDNGSTWDNVIPTEYSATTLIEANSYDCGYRTRTVTGDPYCDGVDKCVDIYNQVSYNSGSTWTTTTTTTTLIEANSYDCGYRTREISGTPYCNYTDHNKYVDVYSQVSNDSGSTWTTTATTTTLYEADSEECGYVPPTGYSDQYLTFEAIDSGTFSFSGSSSSTIDNSSIQYSLNNGSTWNTLNRGNSISVSSGQKVYFKSSTLTPIGFVSGVGTFGIGRFLTTGRFNVEGNIMSLLYGNNFQNQTSLAGKEYAFYSLFSSGCTGLTSAENLVLPATTLAKSCYGDMFGYCTSLTTVPNLPATTLAQNCYSWMYGNCSGLTTVSSNYLPATTLASGCYSSMFCRTSLTSVPNLPATTLAGSCYNGMFDGCRSLTSVPSNYLPATTLANQCYMWMFGHNESLTVAPDLPATTLTDWCYQYMFYGCTSLKYIKCLATNISARYCTNEWVKNVPSSGTFVKNSSMSNWTRGKSGIPSGWTIQNA